MGIFLTEDPWSKALNDALPALIPIGLIGVWRWGMFLFRVVGWLLYRAEPPTPEDKFKTSDVTLIIPTIDTDEEAMHEAMRSWVLNAPKEIIIVTVGEATQKELKRIAETSIAGDITRVLRVDGKANKRIQLVHGIKAANTSLVCFTDDDAIWNANFLKWLLVPFNDNRMGGTGSSQIMRPNDLTKPPTVFERIADMRLSSRMLEAAASTFYDGSVSCLSGRTALYHKRILTDSFPQEFTGELWLRKYPLISGDDKFMTRWIVKHGWKMSMQISPECTLATTFKADGRFFMQILRWTRNTWRSDFKSLVLERNIWYRYPVQAILMCDRMISPFTLTLGPILFVLSMFLVRELTTWTDPITAVAIYVIWVLISRTLRILPHFYRCPEDITYLIFFIGYQYYFAVLKLYALFTLNVTAWGTRAGVGGGSKVEEPETKDDALAETRVQVAKKSRVAAATYQKGNIALMRRMHQAGSDDADYDDAYRSTSSGGSQMAAAQQPLYPPQSQMQMYSTMQPQMAASQMAGSQMQMGGYGAPTLMHPSAMNFGSTMASSQMAGSQMYGSQMQTPPGAYYGAQ